MVDEILEANQLSDADIGKYLMHQATWKMLDQLRSRMGVEESRLPIELAEVGNTVSCTIPILIEGLRKRGQLDGKSVNMLIGFGVGPCPGQDASGVTSTRIDRLAKAFAATTGIGARAFQGRLPLIASRLEVPRLRTPCLFVGFGYRGTADG